MFICHPSYEVPYGSQIWSPEFRSYRLTVLSLRLPWTLLTVWIEEGSERFLQTYCFGWDSDLIDTLKRTSPSKLVSLQVLMPDRAGSAGWVAVDIRAVWELRLRQNEPAELAFESDRGILVGRATAREPSASRSLLARFSGPTTHARKSTH
jgi:hypothetical protein